MGDFPPVFWSWGNPDVKRKRYTEEQIISILKEHEAGATVPALSRLPGTDANHRPSD